MTSILLPKSYHPDFAVRRRPNHAVKLNDNFPYKSDIECCVLYNHGGKIANDLSKKATITGVPASPVFKAGGLWIDSAAGLVTLTTPTSSTDFTIIHVLRKPDPTLAGYISDFGTNVTAIIAGFQSGFWNFFGGIYPIDVAFGASQMGISTGVDALVYTLNGTGNNKMRGWVNGKQFVDGIKNNGTFNTNGTMTIGGVSGNYANCIFYTTVVINRPVSTYWGQQLSLNPFGTLLSPLETMSLNIEPSESVIPGPIQNLDRQFAVSAATQFDGVLQ